MRIVGKKDVVQTLGLVTRNAWEVAVRAEKSGRGAPDAG